MPGTEIDGRGRPSALLAAQARKQFRKAHIALLLQEDAHRQDRRALATVQLQPAGGPVG
jgi:hypothetical protein